MQTQTQSGSVDMVHAAWDTMRHREFVREPYVAVEVWIDLQTKFVIIQTKFLVLQTNFVCMTDHKLENMRQAFGRGGGGGAFGGTPSHTWPPCCRGT